MLEKNINSENKKILLLFIFTILFSMLINVFHPYLWGPDEPRVAEIARETFVGGNYITPHLCGRPFIEKPPLYFDILALSYAMGGINPGVARLVSALLGCIMLAVTFGIGYCWGGLRRAVFATALLIMMPQFYRAAHFIATDIGVGTFCSLALGIFMYYEYWSESKDKKWFLYLFYLASTGAFLTKGLIGIFHIGIVISVFILIRRRWDLLKRMLSPAPVLVFLIPVGVWIYLFYREGGIYFLHEHFINNTIGRFFHIQFKITGSQLALTDIGSSSPWYFYLKRAPVMFAFSVAFLPLILWDALRKLNVLPGSWVLYSEDFKKKTKNWKTIVISFLLFLLNGRKRQLSDKQKDIILILLLWAFLPAFLLSFSSIKEVTYILPSYVAIAVMVAAWLDERLNVTDTVLKGILWFSLLIIPVGIASFTLAPTYPKVYIIAGIVWMSLCLLAGIFNVIKIHLSRGLLVIFAVLTCLVIIFNTPDVMRKTALNRKCHIDLAKYVFAKVKDGNLYIYGGCETLRGSMPFYGKRYVPVILANTSFKKVLSCGENNFVIIINNHLKNMRNDKETAHILRHCEIEPLPYKNLSDDYTLIKAPCKIKK
jgi:4-amino-4-deoxy-L-arabinose transferase-like glycosyltransferase